MLKESIEQHRQGQLEAAEEGYRAHLAERPDDAEALHLLGLLRRQRGDADEARSLIERASTLAPEDAKILLSLGSLDFQQGDRAAARARFEEALSHDPNLALAHSALGRVLLMEGDTEAAAQRFHMALRIGEDAQAHAGLGAIRLTRGDVDGALRRLMRAGELAPNDAAIQFQLGNAFLRRNTLAFAEQALRNALRIAPQLHQAREMLAGLLLQQDRYADAETEFRALAEAPTQAVTGLVGLGDLARKQGRLEDAADHYRAALAQDPRHELATRALAWTQAQQGRHDEAIAAYDAFLALRPGERSVRAARADLEMLAGHLPAALAGWQAIAADDPADAQAASRQALLYEHMGDLERAQVQAELASGLAPDDAEALLVRARAALRAQADPQARELLARAGAQQLPEGPARQRWNHLGRLHDRAGEYAEAVRCFVEAQRSVPCLLPALDEPPPELDAVLAAPAATPWPQAPVLLLGLPGSGIERVVALLADQPELAVLGDRIGSLQRHDDFSMPQFDRYLGELGEDEIAVLRERYLAPLRAFGVPPGRVVVDWLPRWDARLLAFVHRVMPGARLVIVERDPRDALLHWLAFGWAPTIGCNDVDAAAQWLARAARHLHHGTNFAAPARLTVDADTLLADPAGAGVALARFLGLETLQPGPRLERIETGLGGLPTGFPAGHWQAYREALAGPFAALVPRSH